MHVVSARFLEKTEYSSSVGVSKFREKIHSRFRGGRNSHTKSGSIFGLDFGGHENTITNRGTGGVGRDSGGGDSISNIV